MKLSAVHIQNFRSVKDAIVEDIDDFNVFIGKNNSGKSNLLSAIHAFFRILSNGSLVSSQPVIGKLSDFTEKVSSHPISITARFVLSREETIKILTMMREERPQIATALEALPEACLFPYGFRYYRPRKRIASLKRSRSPVFLRKRGTGCS
ncbi:MAG TPA: AAA family ATPase [Stellaceae bacterium]|nr:AAA family ATPase [Stellaceae bacterium]